MSEPLRLQELIDELTRLKESQMHTTFTNVVKIKVIDDRNNLNSSMRRIKLTVSDAQIPEAIKLW